jgi:hypothetical protein
VLYLWTTGWTAQSCSASGGDGSAATGPWTCTEGEVVPRGSGFGILNFWYYTEIGSLMVHCIRHCEIVLLLRSRKFELILFTSRKFRSAGRADRIGSYPA